MSNIESDMVVLNAQQRMNQIRASNKKVLFLAISLLISSFLIAFYLWLDYNFMWLVFTEAKSGDHNLSTFGTLLSGTAGLLIGASTIVFLIYNVKIQNESLQVSITEMEASITEMKDSNKNFLTQKKENLFFNLISNHEKLASNYGLEKINESYNHCKKSLFTYHQAVTNKIFADTLHTTYNPQTLFGYHKAFLMLIKNAIHIYNYIDKHLDDKEFYHQTFYNSLNEGEKFMLGMALENNIVKPEQDSFSELYKKYFWENSPYHNFHKSGIFPVVDLELTIHSREKMKRENFLAALPHVFDLRLSMARTYLGRPIHLSGFDFYLRSFQKKSLGIKRLNIDNFYETYPVGMEIDIIKPYLYMFNYLFEEFAKSGFTNDTYRCTVILHFEYQIFKAEKTYPIKVYQEFDLMYYKTSDPDEMIFNIAKVTNP